MKTASKVALTTTLLLATGTNLLFAQINENEFKPNLIQKVNPNQVQSKGKYYSKMQSNNCIKNNFEVPKMKNREFMFLRGVKLSDEQRYKLSILKDEMELEIKKARGYEKNDATNYFSETKFDKNTMLKDFKNTFDKKIEIRASYMEKAYNLLTDEQKKEVFQNMKEKLYFNGKEQFCMNKK